MSANAGTDIVENGLVLFIDAANNRSYPGSGTTWYDISNNTNTGTLTNGPTFSTTNGGLIAFDGVDDKVVVQNSSLINTNLFTVEVWFKTSTANRRICVKEASDGTTTYSLQVDSSGYINGGSYNPANGINSSFSNTSKTVTDNLWHHAVIAAQSFTTNGLSIYVDSVVQTSTNSTAYFTTTNTDVFTIGNRTFVSSAFSGSIALVKIYNRPLTQAEVSQNFNALRGRFGI